jgi:glycosyltransferase involved in cell wall biosynthesis
LAPFIPAATKRIIEVHTTYTAGLKYLSSVSELDLAGIFTPSHEQRRLVKTLLPANNQLPIEVVPNPLPEQFHCAEPDSRHERPIVVWVGRLDAHKNWRAFVNIATLLRARQIDAEFWIVGGGEADDTEKAALWKSLRDGGLADRFRWVPRVAHDKMSRLYRYVAAAGGCLVSTSQQESFGMVALEAMACGCPVVVPDIGGFRDFVQPNKTGMRYRPGDTGAAEKIIESLLANRPLWNAISSEGAQQARDEYAASAATRKLLAALEQVGHKTVRAAA